LPPHFRGSLDFRDFLDFGVGFERFEIFICTVREGIQEHFQELIAIAGHIPILNQSEFKVDFAVIYSKLRINGLVIKRVGFHQK
jgi:hypothetical protein